MNHAISQATTAATIPVNAHGCQSIIRNAYGL
jgi:hypothetical protein